MNEGGVVFTAIARGGLDLRWDDYRRMLRVGEDDDSGLRKIADDPFQLRRENGFENEA